MIEQFFIHINESNNPDTLFILCGIFIFYIGLLFFKIDKRQLQFS